MTTVLLADDHPMVRRGLRSILEANGEFQVVGETDDGQEAVRLAKALVPDLLILDLGMPSLGGLEVIQRVRQCSPATRIIVFTIHANEAYVIEAMRNGASGYVLKEAAHGEILEAGHRVVAGHRYLSPPLSEHAITVYLEKTSATPLDSLASLTHRERTVLRLAAEGLSTAEIAARLGISRRTAETHRSNLMEKLGLHNQTELIRFALRQGFPFPK